MRLAVLTAALGLVLLSAPASAQLTSDLPGRAAPVEVVESPNAPTLSLAGLFNAKTLDLSHGYQFGYQSGFGGDLGMGIYTTSLRWQPSARLAGRVDVGFAHGAFGSLAEQAGFDGSQNIRPFLQNAEIGWRPTENSLIHLRVSQSPYGAACTYSYRGSCNGYGSGYGAYRSGLSLDASTGSGGLFWRDDLGTDLGGGE